MIFADGAAFNILYYIIICEQHLVIRQCCKIVYYCVHCYDIGSDSVGIENPERRLVRVNDDFC